MTNDTLEMAIGAGEIMEWHNPWYVLSQQRRLYDNLRLANDRLSDRIALRMVMALALWAWAVYAAWGAPWPVAGPLAILACAPLAFIFLQGVKAMNVTFEGAGTTDWETAMRLASGKEDECMLQLISDEIEAVRSVERANRIKGGAAGRIDRALLVLVALVALAAVTLALGVA